MSRRSLEEIRQTVENCRNRDNIGCAGLVDYRENSNALGASHPVLFQIVSGARIMIIGAVPGSIDSGQSKVNYQKLVNGQFSLGHKSAQGLGEIMGRVGEIKDIILPPGITDIPNTESIQRNHLLARGRLGLHVTNLVKCHASTSWENNEPSTWRQAGDACQTRHLAGEVSVLEPEMVILLGKPLADYFSGRENWRRRSLRISEWANEADYLPFYGEDRFVTSWVHPGGRYFWIQGKKYWDLYAQQMAEFVKLNA